MEYIAMPKTCLIILDDNVVHGKVNTMDYSVNEYGYGKMRIEAVIRSDFMTTEGSRIEIARNQLGIIFQDALDNNDQKTVDILTPILAMMDL